MRKASLYTNKELVIFEEQNPIFSKNQMKIINGKTPSSEIEIKKDINGNSYKSVKVGYVKALVMQVTGGNFNFQILSKEFIPASNETVVHAKLIINNFERDQFGQHYVHIKVSDKDKTVKRFPADIGNAYKAAASDAFKKCASEFGFCWDIYGQQSEKKEENKEQIDHSEKSKLKRLEHFLKECLKPEQIEEAYQSFLETYEENKHSKEMLKEHMTRVCKKQ
jgi:hypothetical protein